MVRAREIFGSSAQEGGAGEGGAGEGGSAPRGWRLIREFYRDRLAWVALAVTGLFAAYGGGAVMFWLHSIWLGEGGPDIPPVAHWTLDSTAGFLGLTPALGLVLPLAAQAAGTGRAGPARSWTYIVTAGAGFALLTLPGPVLHDALLARGTWVADQITGLLGPGGGPATPPHDVSTGVSIASQAVAGLPTYIACIALATLTIQLAVALHPRRS